jgi:hypothetical protein
VPSATAVAFASRARVVRLALGGDFFGGELVFVLPALAIERVSERAVV